jgi:hypothetical protein
MKYYILVYFNYKVSWNTFRTLMWPYSGSHKQEHSDTGKHRLAAELFIYFF